MRTGWLRVIRIVLVITLIGDIVALPLQLLQHGLVVVARADIAAVVGPEGFRARFPNLGVNDVQLAGIGRASYFQYLLYSLENGLAYTILTLPIIVYAMRTVRDALDGDPFTIRMARRLRNLGLMLLVGGIVAETVATVAGWVLLDISLPDDGLLRDLSLPDRTSSMWWLLPALLLLAFAAIVKRGVDYRAELEGVI